MDSRVKMARSYNPDVIKSVLFNPEIWDAISEDGQSQANFVVDFNENIFLAVLTEDDELAGLYILHPFNGATLQIHANMLPSFREKYAQSSGKVVLEWIRDHAPPKYQKIIALIPEIYSRVYHFTRKFGFDDEGLLLKAHRKNNQLHNIHILGINRADL